MAILPILLILLSKTIYIYTSWSRLWGRTQGAYCMGVSNFQKAVEIVEIVESPYSVWPFSFYHSWHTVESLEFPDSKKPLPGPVARGQSQVSDPGRGVTPPAGVIGAACPVGVSGGTAGNVSGTVLPAKGVTVFGTHSHQHGKALTSMQGA